MENIINKNDDIFSYLNYLQSELNSINISKDLTDSISITDVGNMFHKIDVNNIHHIEWDKLQQTLTSQLIVGNGVCSYELIIIHHNQESQSQTEEILKFLGKFTHLIEKLECITESTQGYNENGMQFRFKIKKMTCPKYKYISNPSTRKEIKIGFFGEESCGKSTTIGVLVNNEFDDGNGSARKMVLRFHHEMQTGRTFSISQQLMGVGYRNEILRHVKWEEILDKSYKLINLYDMGGSEKALKCTMSMLSRDYIDYAFLVVNAKERAFENTKLFLLIASILHIPVVSIVTMIDCVNSDGLEDFLKDYKLLIKNLKINRTPLVVSTLNDLKQYALNISENIHPILLISNKHGTGVENVLSLISSIEDINRLIYPINNFLPFSVTVHSQFDIHEHFMIESQLILGGIVSKGNVLVGDKYYLGPYKNGNFRIVEIESIHCKKSQVAIAHRGQFTSIKLKNATGEDIRKGMCLLDVNFSSPYAVRTFTAEIFNLESNTKSVKFKYEPVVVINHIRQTCKIKKVIHNDEVETEPDSFDEEYRVQRSSKFKNTSADYFEISCDSKTNIVFEFKNFPEYIAKGANVLINDSYLKAFGTITSIYN